MSDGGWQPGRTADEVRDGDVDASIDAILTDSDGIGNLMLAAERAGLSEDSPLIGLLGREERSRVLREARKTGQQTSMNMATGLSESRDEATGYTKLLNALKPAAQQAVFKGAKGTGKTGTTAESVRWLYKEGVVDKIAMNVPLKGMSIEDLQRAENLGGVGNTHPWQDPEKNDDAGTLAPDVRFCETISGFLEFAKEPGEKVALFDEFSTVGNAYTNQADVQDVMGRAINAFRKSAGGSLRTVYIGHENDADIHPIVRKQSDVVVQKDGKADEGKAGLATVYAGWKDYQKDDPWFKIRGIRDVPKDSPWRYPSNYFSHLEWDLDNPGQQISRGKLIEDWEQYQDTDDPETGEDAETYVQCRGSKADGGDCGATVTHVSGFCHAHRSQWQGDPDPRIADDGGEIDNDRRQ